MAYGSFELQLADGWLSRSAPQSRGDGDVEGTYGARCAAGQRHGGGGAGGGGVGGGGSALENVHCPPFAGQFADVHDVGVE